jgi:hypothetical protein
MGNSSSSSLKKIREGKLTFVELDDETKLYKGMTSTVYWRQANGPSSVARSAKKESAREAWEFTKNHERPSWFAVDRHKAEAFAKTYTNRDKGYLAVFTPKTRLRLLNMDKAGVEHLARILENNPDTLQLLKMDQAGVEKTLKNHPDTLRLLSELFKVEGNRVLRDTRQSWDLRLFKPLCKLAGQLGVDGFFSDKKALNSGSAGAPPEGAFAGDGILGRELVLCQPHAALQFREESVVSSSPVLKKKKSAVRPAPRRTLVTD